MKIGDFETHPAADAFPLLIGADYEALKQDIKDRGLDSDIVLDIKNRILDGRNRKRACDELGIEPRFRIYNGDNEIGFVVAANLRRRHLTDSQRALVATRLARIGRGQRPKDEPGASLTQGDAAELMDVSERLVQQAKAVLDRAEPEVVQAVERGDMSLKEADATIEHQEYKRKEQPAKPVANAGKFASKLAHLLEADGGRYRYVNTTVASAEVRMMDESGVFRVKVTPE